MTRRRRASVTASVAVVAISAGLWLARGDEANAEQKPDTVKPLHDDKRTVSDAERADTLARAQVWRAPATPIKQASFAVDPATPRQMSCKFKISTLGGTTPKFDCDLESGEEIRIKYGKGPEIPAETAATRLLKALGFLADDVVLVERLRCFGCPDEPFSTMKAVELTRAESLYRRAIDYREYEDFDWVARERKLAARPIETDKGEGWAFFELDQIDEKRGGAPRAHVDALRLLAIFLSHWDNKAENQRLVCLTASWPQQTPCPEPFLILQDLGATFGPSKVDLEEWENVKMWHDRATCTVSMQDLPYNGATFAKTAVSEGGRQLLGNMLIQLSDKQLTDFFAAARFDQKRGLFSAPRPVAAWVRAFKSKARAIIEGSPCPTA